MRKSVVWAAVFSVVVMISACRGQDSRLPQKMAIPETFPADIPLYPGARLESVQNVKTGTATWASDTIILSSDDGLAEVAKYYQREVPRRGWVVMARTAVDDQVTMSFSKDGRVVVVGSFRDREKTLISIAHMVE